MIYFASNFPVYIHDEDKAIKKRIAAYIDLPETRFTYKVINRKVDVFSDKSRLLCDLQIETNQFIKNTSIIPLRDDPIAIPRVDLQYRPVVIGGGFCGIFATLVLARAGAKPILLEKGPGPEKRQKSIQEYGKGNLHLAKEPLHTGLGGLTLLCGDKVTNSPTDPYSKLLTRMLIDAGCSPAIRTNALAFLDSGDLCKLISLAQKEIESLGGEVMLDAEVVALGTFFHRLNRVTYKKNGEIHDIKTKAAILATGGNKLPPFVHQASLPWEGERKLWLGVTIEQKTRDMDQFFYGTISPSRTLPPYDLHDLIRLSNGKEVALTRFMRSSCLINESTRENEIRLTAGFPKTTKETSCVSLLLSINKADFKKDPTEALSSLLSYSADKGKQNAVPCETVGDFLDRREPLKLGKIKPTYRPDFYLDNLISALPRSVSNNLLDGLYRFSKRYPFLSNPDGIVSGFALKGGDFDLEGDEIFQNFPLPTKGLFPALGKEELDPDLLVAAKRGIMAALAFIERA